MECATVLKLKLVVYSEYCFDLVIHMEFISVKPAKLCVLSHVRIQKVLSEGVLL